MLSKQKGPSMVRAMIQVLAYFSHLLTVWAHAVQDVLDVGHSGSGGKNTYALYGMPYWNMTGLVLKIALIDFQET
jgi:hypothetical protein